MITPWHLTPEALAVLEDCAKNEPIALLHRITYAGRNTDEWHSYSDPGDTRRDQLVAIKSAVLEPILGNEEACRSGAYEEAGLMVSPDMAIDAVVSIPQCIRYTSEIGVLEKLSSQIKLALKNKEVEA